MKEKYKKRKYDDKFHYFYEKSNITHIFNEKMKEKRKYMNFQCNRMQSALFLPRFYHIYIKMYT